MKLNFVDIAMIIEIVGLGILLIGFQFGIIIMLIGIIIIAFGAFFQFFKFFGRGRNV